MSGERSGLAIEVGRLAVALIVCGNLAFAITSASFSAIDPALTPGAAMRADPEIYIAIYRGRPVAYDTFAKYRVVMPFLVRLIPDLPSGVLFGPGRPVTDDGMVIMKFAIVNLCCLIATAGALGYFTRKLGFTPAESLLAGILFLSTNFVAKLAAYPLSDAGYWLWLLLAAIAIQHQRPWAFAAVMLSGVFVKEQLVLVAALVVLAPTSRSNRARLALAMLPALAAYAFVRFRLAPLGADYHTSGMFLSNLPGAIRGEITPPNLIRLALSFGLLWIPCAYAAARCALPPLLRRWMWFIPIEYAASVLFGAGAPVGSPRFLVATYIVVIPLSVIGMSRWALLRPEVMSVRDVG
jgi:hypothetical protein